MEISAVTVDFPGVKPHWSFDFNDHGSQACSLSITRGYFALRMANVVYKNEVASMQGEPELVPFEYNPTQHEAASESSPQTITAVPHFT